MQAVPGPRALWRAPQMMYSIPETIAASVTSKALGESPTTATRFRGRVYMEHFSYITWNTPMLLLSYESLKAFMASYSIVQSEKAFMASSLVVVCDH